MQVIKRKICKELFTSRKQGNWGQIDGDFISINFCLLESYEDLGLMTLNGDEQYIPGKRYLRGDTFVVNGVVYKVTGNYYAGDYDEETEELTFNPNNSSITPAEGEFFGESTQFSEAYTSSKLMGLRRKKRPLNEDGSEVVPNASDNEDWMILYVPNLVVNVSGDTEEYIEDKQRKTRIVNATGDMVDGNPVIDRANNTITYNYIVGMSLADETLKPDTSTGIHYTDVYIFDPDVFQEVTDYENVSMGNLGVFKTLYSKVWNEKTIGSETLSDAQIESNVKYTDTDHMYHREVFRQEHFLGITYKPITSVDVTVDRGINAAFERHLKLGEIKTLQDMENYANGGFFNLKNDEETTA